MMSPDLVWQGEKVEDLYRVIKRRFSAQNSKPSFGILY